MLPTDAPTPGFPCPRCREHIRITVHQLIHRSRFFCMSCGLELVLDSDESRETVQRLADMAAKGELPPE